MGKIAKKLMSVLVCVFIGMSVWLLAFSSLPAKATEYYDNWTETSTFNHNYASKTISISASQKTYYVYIKIYNSHSEVGRVQCRLTTNVGSVWGTIIYAVSGTNVYNVPVTTQAGTTSISQVLCSYQYESWIRVGDISDNFENLSFKLSDVEYPIAVCGNDVAEYPEVCDGFDFQSGSSCSENGYYGGQVYCVAGCMGLDHSMCLEDSLIEGFTVSPSTPTIYDEVYATSDLVSDVGIVSVVYNLDSSVDFESCYFDGPSYPTEASCDKSFFQLSPGQHEIEMTVTDALGRLDFQSVVFSVDGSADPREAPILQLDRPITGALFQPGSSVYFHVLTDVPYPLAGSAPIDYGLKMEIWDGTADGWVRPVWIDSAGVAQTGDLAYQDTYGVQHYVSEPPFGCFSGPCPPSMIFARYTYGEPPYASSISGLAVNAYRLSARVRFHGFGWSDYSVAQMFTVGEVAATFFDSAGATPIFHDGTSDYTSGDQMYCDASTDRLPRFVFPTFPSWTSITGLGRFIGNFLGAMFLPSEGQIQDLMCISFQFNRHFPVQSIHDVFVRVVSVYNSEAVRETSEPVCVFDANNPMHDMLECFGKRRFYWTIQQAYLIPVGFDDGYSLNIGDLIILSLCVGGLFWVIADWRSKVRPDSDPSD